MINCVKKHTSNKMKLCLVLLALMLAFPVAAGNIQGARNVPSRVVHQPHGTESTSHGDDSPASPSGPPELEIKHKLPTAWIKEYLAYKSPEVSAMLVNDNAPLTSKFTNLERTMSDEDDLRSWTRYIIDHDREDTTLGTQPESQETIDLRIDEFIAFLVEQRGFRAQDLQFLHRQDLDYGYEQIEEELSKIYERERVAKTIEVWGEVLSARRSTSVGTSLLVTVASAAVVAHILTT